MVAQAGGETMVWLKASTAAFRIGVAVETLISWARAGRIPEQQFLRLPKEYRFRSDFVSQPRFLTIRRAGREPIEVGDCVQAQHSVLGCSEQQSELRRTGRTRSGDRR